jgi:hypothetical protein
MSKAWQTKHPENLAGVKIQPTTGRSASATTPKLSQIRQNNRHMGLNGEDPTCQYTRKG